jgi:cellulose biosynthesis protein BcsQ
MRAIKLIIADEDRSYTKGLALYLQEEYGQAFEIGCYTQASILIDCLHEGEAADILLINPELLKKNVITESIKSVVLLVENVDNEHENSIYKYQKADQIAKTLLLLYDKSLNPGSNIFRNNSKCKLICVYSPSGAAGKTTVAYNLANQYAMQGKKILYVSLESYSALTIFTQNESTKGLVYLLYLIKSKLPNIQLKLNAIIAEDYNTNIHFIEREKNVLEYKDMLMEDLGLVTAFFKNQSDYDAVILDLDSTMNEIVLGAFKYCDVIINVYCKDSIGNAKEECFKQQVSKISKLLELDISSKLIEIRNKSDIVIQNENMGDLEAKDCKALLEIPYIKGACISQGAYFPEMTYFKQLYDTVENSF